MILGLNIGHDPSAALVTEDGTVIAAAHESRLRRFKKERRFPTRAIESVLESARVKPSSVDTVVYSSYEPDQLRLIRDKFLCGIGDLNKAARQLLVDELYRLGIRPYEFTRVDHHFAHASAARMACSAPDALIVTCDGYGDDISFSIRWSKDGRVPEQPDRKAPADASLGLIYQYVTGGLGFSMLSEEWKVLGIEPYGNPEGVSEIFENLILDDSWKGIWNAEKLSPWSSSGAPWEALAQPERMAAMRRYMELSVPKFDRNDVASGVQQFIEDRLITSLESIGPTPGTDLALAGGTFLNVRLNRIISELPWVASVSVFPAAGDGGNAVGAALAHLHKKGVTPKPHPLSDVYWGNDYQPTVDALRNSLSINEAAMGEEEIIEAVASAVANGRIVAIARGRSEFGPRALLNRSLICRADRPELTSLLTQRLRRDPVMPYGCSMLSSEASNVLVGAFSLTQCLRFMIAAPYVTEEFARRYRPVCHPVRGGGWSTRPHVVADDDSWQARLLRAVGEKIDGGIVLNTSFNLHGEPIVETPFDAVNSFREMAFPGSLLVVGDRIIPDIRLQSASSRGKTSFDQVVSSDGPRRRREACTLVTSGFSAQSLLSLKQQISTLGFSIIAEHPLVASEHRQEVADGVQSIDGRAAALTGARALLIAGTDASGLVPSWSRTLHFNGGSTIVTAASQVEACRNMHSLFPEHTSTYGAFADLLVRSNGSDPIIELGTIHQTSPVALAGLVYSLDDVLRLSPGRESASAGNMAVVFGISMKVGSLGGRMLLYAPEGLSALIRSTRRLESEIRSEDFLRVRESGLVLVYDPPPSGGRALLSASKIDQVLGWGIDGLVAVLPELTNEDGEERERIAREHGLAVIGGSDCAAADRSSRPYGVSSSGLGRFVNRFPGLEI